MTWFNIDDETLNEIKKVPALLPLFVKVVANRAMTTDREDYIEAAIRLYADDDCEIDDEPAVSPADNGCWVQGWLWVSDDDASKEIDDENVSPVDRAA